MKRGLEGNQKIGGKHRLLLQIHRTQETYQGNVLSGTFSSFHKINNKLNFFDFTISESDRGKDNAQVGD